MHYTLKQYQNMIQEVFDYFVRSTGKEPSIIVPDVMMELAAQVMEEKYATEFDRMDAENMSLPIRSYLRKGAFVLASIFNENFAETEKKIFTMTLRTRRQLFHENGGQKEFNSSYQGLCGYFKKDLREELIQAQEKLAHLKTLNYATDPILKDIANKLDSMPEEIYGWRNEQELVDLNKKYEKRENEIKTEKAVLNTKIDILHKILRVPDYEDACIYCEGNTPLTPAAYDLYGFSRVGEEHGFFMHRLKLNPALVTKIQNRFPSLQLEGVYAEEVFYKVQKESQKEKSVLKSQIPYKFKPMEGIQLSFFDMLENLEVDNDNETHKTESNHQTEKFLNEK